MQEDSNEGIQIMNPSMNLDEMMRRCLDVCIDGVAVQLRVRYFCFQKVRGERRQ